MIRENFLVPFQAAVQEAHAGSVMASYNEIDGVPSHVNHWLLDKVLRGEWGFDGYISSDDDGLPMLVGTHHVARDAGDAARQGLAAGIDFEVAEAPVYRTLAEQVKQGMIPVSEVDRAVTRLLTAKFKLGLFDNPYVDPDYAAKVNNSAEHKQLALETARKAVVLLKNDKNTLPLDLSKLKTIAVIGPNAADVHLGGYSRDPGFGVSVLDGIRARVGDKAKVLYAEGCKITNAPQGYMGWWANGVELIDPKTQTESIKQAVDAARKADVAIVVVGENESTNREAWAEMHRGDRDSLDLLGAQNDLVKAVVETGKPVVVLLLNGRPLSINYIAENVPAILEGFYLGEEGGTAAAEVIFGDVNPGGKLPITFPHTVGALPDFYNHKPSDNRSYEFSTRQPLFPFGFGLSYTTFKFDNLHVEPEQIQSGGTAEVRVDVTNTGTREGDEVAQLYIHPAVSSVTQPVMQLKGFERITLKAGRDAHGEVPGDGGDAVDTERGHASGGGAGDIRTAGGVEFRQNEQGKADRCGSEWRDGEIEADCGGAGGIGFECGEHVRRWESGGELWLVDRRRRPDERRQVDGDAVHCGAGRCGQQGRHAGDGRSGGGRAVPVRWGVVLAGRDADAAGEPVEQERDQLLGQGRRRNLHTAGADGGAQRPERRSARDDELCSRSGMEAVHVSLLRV